MSDSLDNLGMDQDLRLDHLIARRAMDHVN